MSQDLQLTEEETPGNFRRWISMILNIKY